jgi:queuosine precursor transporter
MVGLTSKRELIFLVLAGIFITNAIVAELIGGKLIQIGTFTMSIGVIPWPIVFLTTDLMNEFYGKSGVRRLSLITACLITYAFIILFASMQVQAASFSPVQDEEFNAVFGQSLWIIAGSIAGFLVSQFVDVFIFWLLRSKTGGKMIWLRSTGSTAASQLIDTFVVLGIGFWLPGKITTENFVNLAFTNYSYKLLIALALTPFIYAGHAIIGRYLRPVEQETPDII